MGNLVFQATLGGQVNLVGPNTASTFNLNVPAVSSTIATTSGTETLTNKTLTTPVINGFTGDTSVVNIGSGQFYKDTSGNLGLGVTPSAWASASKAFQFGTNGTAILENYNGVTTTLGFNTYRNSGGSYVYTTTGNAAGLFGTSYTGGWTWNIAPSGTAGNAITFTQAMTLDASGNLGVGTTSPSYRLHVVGGQTRLDVSSAGTSLVCLGTGSNFQVDHSTSGYVTLINSANTGAAMIFKGSSESMRIDTSGNLLVGTTSGTQKLVVSGVTGEYAQRITAPSTSGTYYFEVFYAAASGVGSITSNGTTTTYGTSSDYRLKNVTGVLSGYKQRLLSLTPKQGTWKSDNSEFRGFLAHEFQTVYPASVTGVKDAVDADGNPQYQGMQAGSSEVIADLVAYIKELETRLTALEQA